MCSKFMKEFLAGCKKVETKLAEAGGYMRYPIIKLASQGTQRGPLPPCRVIHPCGLQGGNNTFGKA